MTTTILSEGKEMDPAFQVISIDITKEVNRISYAQIMVLDGDPTQGEFLISDAPFFKPGKEIEIKMRYEDGGSDASVFTGMVIGHGIEVDDRDSYLTVELKDAAVRLTQTRKNKVFLDKTDDKIIGELVGNGGLKKGTIEATKPKHEEIVQYYSTDWDFILSRADINGMFVVVDDGEISLKKMEVAGSPKHKFEFGISEIYDFEMQADATHQYQSVEATAWDLKTQKPTKPAKAKAFKLSQGNLDGAEVAKAVGAESYLLSHPVPLIPDELQAWADARMARSRLSMIRGRIAVAGIPDIKHLDVIELSGIGKRFNGKALVTGIRHRVNEQGWQTDIQFGLSPQWFCRKEAIQETPAAGLLPSVSGLQIGVVDAFENDPEGEFRLKIILPGIDEKEGAVWARLASPDAGKARGFFFRPEVGDEVVVGFFNSDPRQPVVLGAMYGSKNTPPDDFSNLDEKNINKGIVTQKGTTIGFTDDEKASVYIQTVAENKLLLDDDGEAVILSDQHGNTITMNKDGIELKSGKDLKIEASGNIEIKGAKVDVK